MTAIHALKLPPSVFHLPKRVPFSRFRPTRITLFRDGGTIILNGRLGKRDSTIRMDGRLSSPTRGSFFVSFPKDVPERLMTAQELAELRPAMVRYRSAHPHADSAYGILVSRLGERGGAQAFPALSWLVKHRLDEGHVPPAIKAAARRMETDYRGYEVENISRLPNGQYVLLAASDHDPLWVKARMLDAGGQKLLDAPLRVRIA